MDVRIGAIAPYRQKLRRISFPRTELLRRNTFKDCSEDLEEASEEAQL